MSSWADQSDDPALENAPSEFSCTGSSGGGGGGRPRLQLKPRSAKAAQDAGSGAGGSSKNNPFGAAKPREQGKL